MSGFQRVEGEPLIDVLVAELRVGYVIKFAD